MKGIIMQIQFNSLWALSPGKLSQFYLFSTESQHKLSQDTLHTEQV